MSPCPLCGQIDGGRRIGSELVRQAFGDGSCHETCLDDVMESLRSLEPAPEKWPALLRQIAGEDADKGEPQAGQLELL